MDDLETSRLVTPHRGSMSLVPCLPFPSCVLEHNVRGLEDLDWQSMGFILSDCLQQTRNQCCSDDLEFEGFRVRNLDASVAIIFVV